MVSKPYFLHSYSTGERRVQGVVPVIGASNPLAPEPVPPGTLRDAALERFWDYASKSTVVRRSLPDARRATLGCYDAPMASHADILRFLMEAQMIGNLHTFCELSWPEARLVIFGTTDPITDAFRPDRDLGRVYPKTAQATAPRRRTEMREGRHREGERVRETLDMPVPQFPGRRASHAGW